MRGENEDEDGWTSMYATSSAVKVSVPRFPFDRCEAVLKVIWCTNNGAAVSLRAINNDKVSYVLTACRLPLFQNSGGDDGSARSWPKLCSKLGRFPIGPTTPIRSHPLLRYAPLSRQPPLLQRVSLLPSSRCNGCEHPVADDMKTVARPPLVVTVAAEH